MLKANRVLENWQGLLGGLRKRERSLNQKSRADTLKTFKGCIENFCTLKTFLFSLFFVFLLITPDISLSQSRLDVPTANLEIEKVVPFPLVKRIASLKSKEIWGHGALGEPISLSDPNGNIIAYMFSFYIGGERFLTYDEILLKIKKGRELREYIKNFKIDMAKETYKILKQEQTDARKSVISDNSKSQYAPQLAEIEPKRPDGSTPRRIEIGEIREIEKFAARKAIGAGEFGTIIVSATYDMFPVPVYMHYLASYYTHFDLSLERAEQIIGKGAFLKRIYFLGLDGQYFEFENNANITLINSKTLRTKNIEEVHKLRKPEVLLRPEIKEEPVIKEDIVKEWEKIKSEVGEK